MRTLSFITLFIIPCSPVCWSFSIFLAFIGITYLRLLCCRGNCDIFSVVDLSRNGQDSAAKPMSNLVVDTLRIVTGIPQSRMTDILEDKSPEVDGSDDVEALL